MTEKGNIEKLFPFWNSKLLQFLEYYKWFYNYYVSFIRRMSNWNCQFEHPDFGGYLLYSSPAPQLLLTTRTKGYMGCLEAVPSH